MIIWLASYPKSGNTWVRFFLKSYLSSPDKNLTLRPDIDDNFFIKNFPSAKLCDEMKIDYLNFHNIVKNWIPMQEFLNLNNKINFLKTHNAMCTINNYPFTNSNNTLGAIYIVRDPRDIVISYADHFQVSHKEIVENMFSSEHGEAPTKNGKSYNLSIMGTWSDHYNSWKNFKKNYLLIKYENLLYNPKEEFLKITKYLNLINGYKFEENKIMEAIENTKFSKLSNQEDLKGYIGNSPKNKELEKKFFNLGPKNKWEDLLEGRVKDQIEKIFKEEMKELNYI